MNLLRRMSFSQRHALLTLLSVAALLACVFVGMNLARQLSQHFYRATAADKLVADLLPPPLYLVDLRLVLSQAHEGTLARADAKKEVQRLTALYAERVAHWEARPITTSLRQSLEEPHREALRFIAKAQEWLALPEDAPPELRQSALFAAHQAFSAHRSGIDKASDSASRVADTESSAFERYSQNAQRILLCILVLGPLGLLLLSGLIARSITRPLKRSVDLAMAIAQGDLTQEFGREGNDEAAQLTAALSVMRASLVDLVRQVRANGQDVHQSTGQLMTSSETLIARSDHNCAELKTTGSAMKDVTTLVQANADAADHAKRLATDTAQRATSSAQTMALVGETMASIVRSSAKVSDMVSLIDDVAFQTNLLSLNAAVEAARAGPQGRGFAVVAGEVRRLAQRSGEAAKQIRALVAASDDEVQNGGRTTDGAKTTILALVDQVQQVNALVNDIWETTFAQTSGINMLVESIDELLRYANETSDVVLQTAALAQCMTTHASRMEKTVANYRLPAPATV
jgi:methyl-accepting chemotaxis protein